VPNVINKRPVDHIACSSEKTVCSSNCVTMNRIKSPPPPVMNKVLQTMLCNKKQHSFTASSSHANKRRLHTQAPPSIPQPRPSISPTEHSFSTAKSKRRGNFNLNGMSIQSLLQSIVEQLPTILEHLAPTSIDCTVLPQIRKEKNKINNETKN